MSDTHRPLQTSRELTGAVLSNGELAAIVGVAAVVCASAGWSVPIWMLGISGAFVAASAVYDLRCCVIPNEFVAPASACVAVCAALMIVSGAAPGDLAAGAVAGAVMSGAVVLFVIWLVRADLIGGGDWKLLTVIGVALGMVDPLAAGTAGVVAVAAQVIASVVTRRRMLPFGPALLAGHTMGAISTIWFHAGAGGWV